MINQISKIKSQKHILKIKNDHYITRLMKKIERGIYPERGVSPFQFDPLSNK
jgi:hypothetical protein